MLPLCVQGGAPGLPAACVGASLQSQLSSEGVEAETKPLSVHVQMCSRDLKQTPSVSVGSLFVLALTPVPCALCVDLSDHV